LSGYQTKSPPIGGLLKNLERSNYEALISIKAEIIT